MTTAEHATAAGHCCRCDRYGDAQKVVVEIPGDSGPGAVVVRCPEPCRPARRPSLRRHPAEPRTWST